MQPRPGDKAFRPRPLQRRPQPPNGFVDITDITKLTGLFGQRWTP